MLNRHTAHAEAIARITWFVMNTKPPLNTIRRGFITPSHPHRQRLPHPHHERRATQVQISAKSNETPAFTPLPEQVAARHGGMTGVVFVAEYVYVDALPSYTMQKSGWVSLLYQC